ncbi:MAG: hypothetical protein R3C10_02705 [Pirellulales bacterium]
MVATSNNITQVLYFSDVVPNVNAASRIGVEADPDNDNEIGFFYVNLMQVVVGLTRGTAAPGGVDVRCAPGALLRRNSMALVLAPRIWRPRTQPSRAKGSASMAQRGPVGVGATAVGVAGGRGLAASAGRRARGRAESARRPSAGERFADARCLSCRGRRSIDAADIGRAAGNGSAWGCASPGHVAAQTPTP